MQFAKRSLSTLQGRPPPDKVWAEINEACFFSKKPAPQKTKLAFPQEPLVTQEMELACSPGSLCDGILTKVITNIGLDSNDEEMLLRTKAALENRYPEQYKYIFADDLAAAQGAESIRVNRLYLQRAESLYHGTDPKREQTRAKDKEAIELLYKRGILSDQIVEQLKAWIETVESVPDIQGLLPSEADRQNYLKALFALDTWFSDWSQTARTAITRRDHLISLGIASRRESKDTNTEEETTTPPDIRHNF